MLRQRLLLDAIAAAVLAIALGVVGFLVAEPILRAVAVWVGLRQLYFLGPSDMVWSRLGIAAPFVSPPLVSFGIGLIDRGVGRRVPSLARLGAYVVAAAAGMVGGLLVHMTQMRTALRAVVSGVEPVLMTGGLEIGPAAWRGAIGAAVLLCIAAAIAARRP
jgi:hypothetical protein